MRQRKAETRRRPIYRDRFYRQTQTRRHTATADFYSVTVVMRGDMFRVHREATKPFEEFRPDGDTYRLETGRLPEYQPRTSGHGLIDLMNYHGMHWATKV